MLGKFLEVSLYAQDILDSVAFWERIGFRQIPTNDTWAYPYAQVTDGRAFVGLHTRELDSPSLTFVRMELAGHLAPLRDAGVAFDYAHTADDQFNQAGFVCPDGQRVALLESRTFSPPPFRDSDFSLLGAFEGFMLPVRSIDQALPFWAKLGLAVLDYREGPVPAAELTDGMFVLMLREDPAERTPALVFSGDAGHAAEQVESRTGIAGKRRGEELRIITPEGIPVIVR